jgi:hypothetical protein
MQTKPAIFFLTVFLTVLLFSTLIHPAFATTIFSDGVESGDFSAWTELAGATASVQSTVVHHGSYAAKWSLGTSTSAYCDLKKVFASSYSTIYMRIYFYFSNSIPDNNAIVYILRNQKSGVAWISGVYIKNVSGQLRWGIENTVSGTKYDSTASPTLNTWYCVELKTVISTSAGELRLYIDGTEILTKTGLNTGTNSVDAIVVGSSKDGWSTAQAFTGYTDCVVVADTYIGPEAGQEYSLTLTETVKPSAALNVWQEHAYTFSQTIIQTSSLQYGAEAIQTLTQTVTAKETRTVLHEQVYVFTENVKPQTILSYAAELAEVFITNIETIAPREIVTYWIEELITPLDWSMVALGMAVIAFVVAAAAFAFK